MLEKVYGIDFGTTSTVIFECENSKLKQVKINGKAISLSSFYYDDLGELHFGEVNQRSIFSLKRFVGSEKKFFDRSVQDILGDIFKFFHSCIEKHEMESQDQSNDHSNFNDVRRKIKAIITVPAFYSDVERNLMRSVALQANFDVIKILNEPTAAIFGHEISEDGIFGVYDFGGGTFDFSIVEYKNGVHKVLGTSGDLALGGDDIDFDIISHLEQKYSIQIANKNSYFNKKSLKNLKSNITLNVENFDLDLEINEKKDIFSSDVEFKKFQISKKSLIEIVEKYIRKTIDVILSLMRERNVGHLDGVILVGGSSKFPMICDMIKKTVSVDNIFTKNPEEIVAIGASEYADFVVNSKSRCLIDVTPLTLGIEVYGGFVDPIILRNSSIPIEKTEIYAPSDSSRKIKINILQGERDFASKCTSLGTIFLENNSNENNKIYVTFKIDRDGILSVRARNENSSHEVTINPIHHLTKDKVEKILINASEDGVDDLKKRILLETKMKADILIDYVENAVHEYASYLDEKFAAEIHDDIENVKKNYSDLDALIKSSAALEQKSKKLANLILKLSLTKILD